MQWDQIYKTEVAPVLAQFSAGPPLWVYAALGLALLGGVALLVWTSGGVRLSGLVLVFIAGFILYMMHSGTEKARTRPAEYRTGVVNKKYTLERPVRRANGMMEPQTSYWIELRVNEARNFGAHGAGNALPVGPDAQAIGVDESLYAKVREGATITGVILPTANDHFHFVVEADGSIIR